MGMQKNAVRSASTDNLLEYVRLQAGKLAFSAGGPFHSEASDRDTLQRRTYETLRHALMAGVFKPGQGVTLRSIAAALGTSAMPVREAVSRLIAERALTLLPNRTVIVPHMTRKRCVELFQTRQVLEKMATVAAASRANSELTKQLSGIDLDVRTKVGQRDVHGAVLANMRFHFTLYRAGQTEVILPLIEALWLQAGPFTAYSLSIPGVRWMSRHHQTLLAALRSGKPTAAGRAVEMDIEETLGQLLMKANFGDDREQRDHGRAEHQNAMRSAR